MRVDLLGWPDLHGFGVVSEGNGDEHEEHKEHHEGNDTNTRHTHVVPVIPASPNHPPKSNQTTRKIGRAHV